MWTAARRRTAGFCTMGCRIGAKRSTLVTYLQEAADGGARIVVDADVRLIETDLGQVTGVVAQVGDHTLEVRASAVVLAALGRSTPQLCCCEAGWAVGPPANISGSIR